MAPESPPVPEPGNGPVDPASPDQRRMHPVSPFLGLVGFDPRTLLALGALIAGGGRGALVAVALGALVTTRLVEWWRTSYELAEDRLVVRSGLLNRTTRIVAPARVQQVEVIRRLRHRLAGLTAVTIELAESGSGDRAIVLDAVTAAEAQRIQDTLERARRSGGVPLGPDAPPAPPPAPLLTVSSGLLALGGVTGAPLLLVPLAAFTFADEVGELAGDRVDPGGLEGPGLAAALVVGLVVWVAFAAGQMVLRHGGLTVSRSGGDLRISRGLVERRMSVIPVARVQLVEISATLVRRVFGLATVDVRTAGVLELEGSGSLDNAIPIAGSDDATRIAAELLRRSDGSVPQPDRPHPAAARWRSLLRRLPAVGAVTVIAAAAGGRTAALVAAAGGLTVAAVGSARWWASLGHTLERDVVAARSGVWNRSLRFGRLDKVQSVSVGQGPVQRLLGLHTVTAHLAGGGTRIVVRDVSTDGARRLVRELAGPRAAAVSRLRTPVAPVDD